MELMRLIHSSAQVFTGILLSFSACARNPPVGDKIFEGVAKISTKPVLAVFNSHIHGDHWPGNQALKRAYPEIDIYAHAKTIAQSQASEGASWLQLMLPLTGDLSRGTEIFDPQFGPNPNKMYLELEAF
jgi:glyoxylase-like metal-dependent hydrolase (beta-lactamase superfamily II)